MTVIVIKSAESVCVCVCFYRAFCESLVEVSAWFIRTLVVLTPLNPKPEA